MDARRKRLAELRLQLDSLYVTGATTVLGSPERQAVLEQLEPLLASIHALNDELEVDPITAEDPRSAWPHFLDDNQTALGLSPGLRPGVLKPLLSPGGFGQPLRVAGSLVCPPRTRRRSFPCCGTRARASRASRRKGSVAGWVWLQRILASPCAAPPLGWVLRRFGHGPIPGSPRCAPERDPLARHPPCLPRSGGIGAL